MRDDFYKQVNCYSLLGVASSATPSEIKSAFRRASLKSHPDVGGSNEAQAKVNLAYEVLSDPVRRQAHDFFWKVASGQSSARREGSKAEKTTNEGAQAKPRQTGTTRPPLSAIRDRLERAVQSRKAAIWSELGRRAESKVVELELRLSRSRRSAYYLIAASIALATLAAYYPLFWVAIGGAGLLAVLKMRGIEVRGKRYSAIGHNAAKLREHAREIAAEQCQSEAAGLDRYLQNFATFIETAMRSSSFDDSEIHIARRISVALFLMGYEPVSYDSESRAILLVDKDERLVVRFRHRTGQAVNISYVERLRTLMQAHRATQGILFCSPGLSGNAARLADTSRIRWHSLESMNKWIDDIAQADYAGPSGDILSNLDKLERFLSGIVPKLGRSSRRNRRW